MMVMMMVLIAITMYYCDGGHYATMCGAPLDPGMWTWYIDKKKDFDSPDITQIKMLFLTFIFYQIILLQGSRFLYIHAPKFPVEDNDHYNRYPLIKMAGKLLKSPSVIVPG